MKKKINKITAALFVGILSVSLAQAATTVHIEQNFESYDTGPLTTGGGWISGANVQSNIVSSPAQGTRALQIGRSGGGSLSYSSDGTGNQSLILANEQSYQWSFDFHVDVATPETNQAGSFIWLDTGVNGRSFAGLRIHYNSSTSTYDVAYFSDLDTTTPSGLDNYTFLGSIDTGEWYTATFDISVNSAGLISQNIDVAGFTPVSFVDQANTAFNDGATHVRMNWSPQINGSLLQYDNLYLATIPEPQHAAFIIMGLGVIGIWVSRKMRFGWN